MPEDNVSIEETVAYQRAEYLLDFEDEILSMSEVIIEGLDENIEKVDKPGEGNLFTPIINPLSAVVSEEDASDIARGLLNFVSNYDSFHSTVLRELGSSPEFIKFVNILTSSHQKAIQTTNLAAEQGEDFWARLETDYVLRGPGNRPGINIRLYKGREEERIDISADLDSTIHLANLLLRRYSRGLEIFGQSGSQDGGISRIGETVQLAEDLRKRAAEIEQEESDQ